MSREYLKRGPALRGLPAFLWRRVAIALIAWTAVSQPILAQTKQSDPFEPTVGETIWGSVRENMGTALSEMRRANSDIAGFNTEIAVARQRFWAAFPDKPDFGDAQREFGGKLWAKDVFFLTTALPEGADGRAARIVQALVAKVDGGIRPNAYPAFLTLVDGLRRSLGAQSRNDMVYVDGGRLMRALDANQDRLMAYKRARDLAEFLASGLDPRLYLSPKAYLLQVFETDLLGMRWTAGVARPDPQQDALRTFDTLVSCLGEDAVLAAAKRVFEAKKDGNGNLATPAPVKTQGGGDIVTTSPLQWFEELLAEDARGYAVTILRTSLHYLPHSWAEATKEYQELVDAHGEEAVLSAADRVRRAPKMPWGTLGDYTSPSTWFKRLLENPAAELPGPVPRLSVTDLAGLRAIGPSKAVIATGRVSHVTTESGGGAIVYHILHFEGVSNDMVKARMTSGIARYYGEPLAGKVVRMTTDFFVDSDGVLFRINMANQIEVLTDEEARAELDTLEPIAVPVEPKPPTPEITPTPTPPAETRTSSDDFAPPVAPPASPVSTLPAQIEPTVPAKGKGAATALASSSTDSEASVLPGRAKQVSEPEQVSRPVSPAPQPVSPPPSPAPDTPTTPMSGDIFWSGPLKKNQTVTIDFSLGARSVGGQALPGKPVRLETFSPVVEIVELPGPQNGWRRFSFKAIREAKANVTLNFRWSLLP